MDDKTLKILTDYMGIGPHEVIQLDKFYRNVEHGDYSDEVNEKVSEMLADIQHVMDDGEISDSIRLGFALSAGAIAVALQKQLPPSRVFLDLAKQCVIAEREKMLLEALTDPEAILVELPTPVEFMQMLLGDREHIEIPNDEHAPDCPECHEKSRYCGFHDGWECANGSCPHVGLIDTVEND